MSERKNPQVELLDALPAHPAPGIRPDRHLLWVGGAVSLAGTYSIADLMRYPQVSIAMDFRCEEGWEVREVRWRGVRLGTLIDLAAPQPDAGWAALSSGDFSITLTIEDARAAFVALSLNDEPLPVAHGGPMRLLIRGGECYTSIKWLDQVEVTTRPREGTARVIAMRRIGREAEE